MNEYTETVQRELLQSENDDLYAGVVTLKDGSTQIKSGSLSECAQWADEMMKSSFSQIEIRRVR